MNLICKVFVTSFSGSFHRNRTIPLNEACENHHRSADRSVKKSLEIDRYKSKLVYVVHIQYGVHVTSRLQGFHLVLLLLCHRSWQSLLCSSNTRNAVNCSSVRDARARYIVCICTICVQCILCHVTVAHSVHIEYAHTLAMWPSM